MSVDYSWSNTEGVQTKYREKTYYNTSLCPPHMLEGTSKKGTKGSDFRGWRLTA